MKGKLAPWQAWTLFVFWVLGLQIATSLPGQQVEKVMFFEGFDKLVHFAVFILGGLLLHTALSIGRSTARWHRWCRTIATVLLLALLGAMDEVRQIWTPGRVGSDLGDFTADFLGAMTAAVACHFYHVKSLSRAPTADS